MNKEWFASWFDSPYYHILYQDRDLEEAHNFMEKLDAVLGLPEKAEVLDLACGRGRHSRILHQFGYRVTGADLSCASIYEAQKSSEEGLEFLVHDMREVIPDRAFHAVFNLFTSFGYFEDHRDNVKVLQSIRVMLRENGLLILDFMNVDRVLRELVEEERKFRGGIEFTIRRQHLSDFIVKEISFIAEGQPQHFAERVRVLRENDFTSMLEAQQFTVLHRFGDFNLSAFDPIHSERLILIAQKN
jgi:SAM-dependent methyltransferase